MTRRTRFREHCRTFEEVLLRAIPPYQEVMFGDIARTVRNDWGSVCDRTIFRFLVRLRRSRRIRRAGPQHQHTYQRAS